MKKLLLILMIAPFLSRPAYAEAWSGGFDPSALTEALPDSAQSIAETYGEDGLFRYEGALEKLWSGLLASVTENLRSSLRELCAILCVILLCSVFTAPELGRKQQEHIQIGACAIVSVSLSQGMNAWFRQAMDSLSELCTYASAALPTVYTAAAASGAIASTSAKYAAAWFGLDLLMNASERLILPLICSTLALSVCASIFENPVLRSMIRLIRRAAGLLMSLMTVAFTVLLSISGLISGSADAVAGKAARTLLSTAIPVVGRIVSDAADSVLLAAAAFRNSAGAFGIVAVCALCIPPFASLAVRRVLLSLASTVAETTDAGRLSRLLNDLGSVLSLLLGLVGSYALMLFFALFAAMRTVRG